MIEQSLLDITRQFLHESIGLITILNPIAAAALMISTLSPDTTKKEVADVAKRTTLTVFIASVITVFLGELIFNFFGISTSSIEVIGGIVILRLAIKMVEGEHTKNHSAAESLEAKDKNDISVIPLAIPILFGPGVITTLILFKSSDHSIVRISVLLISIVLASITVYFTLKNSRIILERLGITGLKIVTRVMGLIVGALAIQFVLVGTYTLWQTFGH